MRKMFHPLFLFLSLFCSLFEHFAKISHLCLRETWQIYMVWCSWVQVYSPTTLSEEFRNSLFYSGYWEHLPALTRLFLRSNHFTAFSIISSTPVPIEIIGYWQQPLLNQVIFHFVAFSSLFFFCFFFASPIVWKKLMHPQYFCGFCANLNWYTHLKWLKHEHLA